VDKKKYRYNSKEVKLKVEAFSDGILPPKSYLKTHKENLIFLVLQFLSTPLLMWLARDSNTFQSLEVNLMSLDNHVIW